MLEQQSAIFGEVHARGFDDDVYVREAIRAGRQCRHRLKAQITLR